MLLDSVMHEPEDEMLDLNKWDSIDGNILDALRFRTTSGSNFVVSFDRVRDEACVAQRATLA